MKDFTHVSPEVGNQAASVIHIESPKIGMIIMGIFCGLAIALAIAAIISSRNSERETRMLEYYLLELDSKFIRAGLKDPSESIAEKLKSNQEVEK